MAVRVLWYIPYMEITRRSLFAIVFAAPLAVNVASPKGSAECSREIGENPLQYYVGQRCRVMIEDFKSVRLMPAGDVLRAGQPVTIRGGAVFGA